MSKVSRRMVLRLATAMGLAGFASASAITEDKKTDDKWRAWAVTDGNQTKLMVEGIYSQGGPGSVVLIKDAIPQGINSKILLLDLKTATLPGVWSTVLQPVPASYVKTPYRKDQYESVQIRYPGGKLVSIDNIIDTGNGPK